MGIAGTPIVQRTSSSTRRRDYARKVEEAQMLQIDETIRIMRRCVVEQGIFHLEEFLYAGEQCIVRYRPMSLDDAKRFEAETLRNLNDSDNQSPIITEILANCDECMKTDCWFVADA
jgi:hypothetical protein